MALGRSLALVGAVWLCPVAAGAAFNIHDRYPNDLRLRLDFDDGVEELAGVGMSYSLDGYIWGISVEASYDRALFVEGDPPVGDTMHGGSLGGQFLFSPIAFVGIVIEDKLIAGQPRSFRRFLEFFNVWIPAGVRVGLGHDGEEPRARLAAWLGAEVVLRYASADWPFWPHVAVAWRRQIGLPEDRASDHVLFQIGFTRFVHL